MVGEHPPVGREVRAVERVVHDEDRRTLRAVARLLGEALAAVGAVGAGPGTRRSCSSPPPTSRSGCRRRPRRGRRSPNSSAKARSRSSCCGKRDADRLLEQRVGRGRGAQLGPAEVVRAALQQRERERQRRRVPAAPGGPSPRAGSAARSSKSRRRPSAPTRRPARGTRGSCPTRSAPRRPDGGRRRSRRRPRRESAAARRAARRRSRARRRREARVGSARHVTSGSDRGIPPRYAARVGRTLLAMRLRTIPARDDRRVRVADGARHLQLELQAGIRVVVAGDERRRRPRPPCRPPRRLAPVACHPAAGLRPGNDDAPPRRRGRRPHLPGSHAAAPDYRDATRRRLPRRDVRHVPAGHLQRLRSRCRQVRLRRRDARTESTPRSASGDSSARWTTCTSRRRSCARSRRTRA